MPSISAFTSNFRRNFSWKWKKYQEEKKRTRRILFCTIDWIHGSSLNTFLLPLDWWWNDERIMKRIWERESQVNRIKKRWRSLKMKLTNLNGRLFGMGWLTQLKKFCGTFFCCLSILWFQKSVKFLDFVWLRCFSSNFDAEFFVEGFWNFTV